MRDAAIVLQTRAYGDADAVVALFCRDAGRVGLFARGLRSPKRKETPLVPTSEITLELKHRPGSDLHTARAVDLTNAHAPIRNDLVRLSAANVVLEVLKEVYKEGQGDQRIYAIASHTLTQLETEDPMLAVLAFEVVLLRSFGLGEPGKTFREHTRAFEELRGRQLPARDFFLKTLT